MSDGLLDRTKAIRWAVRVSGATLRKKLEAMAAIELEEEITPRPRASGP